MLIVQNKENFEESYKETNTRIRYMNDTQLVRGGWGEGLRYFFENRKKMLLFWEKMQLLLSSMG